MAFPQGNNYGAKRREFEQRMRAAIEQDEWKRVRQGIERVLSLCAEGERWALELVRDTLDGKPKQQIEAVDDQGRALAVGLVAFVAESEAGRGDPLPLHATALPTPDPEGEGQRH